MTSLPDLNTLVARTKGLRDNGSRAVLKRALGRPLETSPAALPLVAAALPASPDPTVDDAVLMTAAAVATWPDMHEQRIGLGAALAATGDPTAAQRLAAAARASSDLLCQRHLPDLLRIIDKGGGRTDLALLGLQAAGWPARQDDTARQWLRGYYRAVARASSGTTDAASPKAASPTTPQQPTTR